MCVSITQTFPTHMYVFGLGNKVPSTMSIDDSFSSSVLEQKFTTAEGFIEMMFKDVKQDARELRKENEELRKSLTFSQRGSSK